LLNGRQLSVRGNSIFVNTPQNITVLHLVHRYTVGGAEAVVNYLCRFLPTHVKNIICTFYEQEHSSLSLHGSAVEIICLNKHSGNDLKAVMRLGEIIRRKNVDVVHAQGWATYIEGLLAAKLLNRKKCRFVYAFHGKTIADVTNGIPRRRRMAQRVAAEFTDRIIAPSCQMAEDYANISGLPAEKVQVIYNGIDLSCYGRHHNDARRKLGIRSDEFVIGFVGRLDKVKNLSGLFKAFQTADKHQALSGHGQRWRLLLVGDGTEFDNLQDLAGKLNIEKKVLFLGMRNDVGLCLSAMDVYAQPSFYEGHSNTILEAMAAGLPVISTDVGGTPEIITHNKTGLLFHPEDHDGMSKAMLSLWQDDKKRRTLAEAGQKIVQQQFSVETMAKAYADLFNRLAAQ
jgi:L-malate glycosyltransferase